MVNVNSWQNTRLKEPGAQEIPSAARGNGRDVLPPARDILKRCCAVFLPRPEFIMPVFIHPTLN